jgi:hypothetical protein
VIKTTIPTDFGLLTLLTSKLFMNKPTKKPKRVKKPSYKQLEEIIKQGEANNAALYNHSLKQLSEITGLETQVAQLEKQISYHLIHSNELAAALKELKSRLPEPRQQGAMPKIESLKGSSVLATINESSPMEVEVVQVSLSRRFVKLSTPSAVWDNWYSVDTVQVVEVLSVQFQEAPEFSRFGVDTDEEVNPPGFFSRLARKLLFLRD